MTRRSTAQERATQAVTRLWVAVVALFIALAIGVITEHWLAWAAWFAALAAFVFFACQWVVRWRAWVRAYREQW
jgi:predicted histidine transporter YuiF (NhaC family)